ncbi:Flagellar biosynthetic protein FlhB [Ascidiaceihabitans donghaensis]|uniref:Flagellar biosynthetic protein FlhB n=1 Tax=Ascidiaceihabitans donghaensis TaxID=1510460 RepID=A0A2R8B8G6_9RHOB|nr:flagellar type III secretion system protein FlhB [Ascidiaceihabitans donghaensis]SPH19356.1 Flagellar biosynthetic protein FlhB [Ascidiaceihabitans donghaensis]
MSGSDDDTDKSFDPSAKKLADQRKKGEIARSADLLTASAYFGLILAFLISGSFVVTKLGTVLSVLLDQSSNLSQSVFAGAFSPTLGGVFFTVSLALVPVFGFPFISVLAAIIAQNGLVFAPTKLEPKLSKISPISNAKNKFGRNGLFEFGKSFTKLVIYSTCLAVFLKSRILEIVSSAQSEPNVVVSLLGELCITFLILVVLISAAIGGVDALWQHAEHIRKNRMSHKELMDEAKESEGDPHLKAERRQRAQSAAMSQMMGDVPDADVIIVNPTHYAVALKWSRAAGSAPNCVAKGIDDVALRIREVAAEAGVPIHSDPPTARALHAVTEIGEEISPEHYQAVAAAVRFAEETRKRAQRNNWS